MNRVFFIRKIYLVWLSSTWPFIQIIKGKKLSVSPELIRFKKLEEHWEDQISKAYGIPKKYLEVPNKISQLGKIKD